MSKRQVRKWAGRLFLTLRLICLTVVVINLTKDCSIWVFGRRTTAEVRDAWIKQIDHDVKEPVFQYFVRYRFATLDGQIVTGTSRVGAQEWAGLGMSRMRLVAGRRLIRPPVRYPSEEPRPWVGAPSKERSRCELRSRGLLPPKPQLDPLLSFEATLLFPVKFVTNSGCQEAL